nr:MAG TPA: hypothetical protein [Caudoviricetes sp.]
MDFRENQCSWGFFFGLQFMLPLHTLCSRYFLGGILGKFWGKNV